MTTFQPEIKTIQLTPHQQAAYSQIETFVSHGSDHTMMSLIGYAGTGKTTLISELIHSLAQEPEILRIGIAAPTNKAVGVLQEKIPAVADITFGSIHSFLGLRLKEHDSGDQVCRQEGQSSLHEYDLIIIDEASMISKELFKLIALGIRGATKIIFIGDPCQLPPVGDKSQSPVFEMVQNQSVLSEVVRQAEGNPIIALSMKIRSCIEKDAITTPEIISSTLPPADQNPSACVAYGGNDTIKSWALHELRDGRDCRILAFTNNTVQRYNQHIHDALHGITPCQFVEGERAIVHESTEARSNSSGKVSLHTSEEVVIEKIEQKKHAKYPEIDAFLLTLAREGGQTVEVYLAENQENLQLIINAEFKAWRESKSQAQIMKAQGDSKYPLLEQEAKAHSARAWAIRRSFAPLRHTYALTTHKSQGSTFDTAIIDYSDLSKIKDAFDFNRALYVAVTRPREYLAIVL